MKKLKTFVFIMVCLLSSTFLFACNEPIKVESISLSETEIVLRPGESKDVFVTVKPDNATNKNFEYVLTDDSFITFTVNETDKTKATITAKTDLTGTFTAFLQAVSEDGNLRSEPCLITVYTDKTKLFAPQNLRYEHDSQLICWDKIDSASGYSLKVSIEGQEDEDVFCSANFYKIDEYYNKKISVKVKSVGDNVLYLDSDYSDNTFTFMQLEEPKNLTNVKNKIKFDKVENAERYEIYVYEGSLKDTPDYTYSVNDSDFNENEGYELYILNNPGKKYFVKVKAFAAVSSEVVCYESKCVNYIEVNKIATPLVNNSNLKFTYSTNTISWTSNPNASGYKLNRYKNGVLDKEYTFTGETANTNMLIIDTSSDKLLSGKYEYKLIVLGNGVNYLDSEESEGLAIEKLSSPVMQISGGEIVWNEIENISGYTFEIVGRKTENLTKNQTNYSLANKFNETFAAGTYRFRIKSLGNGTNTISSEFSEICSFDKLTNPEMPTLVDNKYVVINVLDVVTSVKVSITHLTNSGSVDFVEEKVLSNFDLSSSKTARFDLQDGLYNENLYPEGNYKISVKAFGNGFISSEFSDTLEVYKLSSKTTLKVENGELSYSKPENCNKVEVLLNGVKVYSENPEDFDINTINGFEAGREYYIELRYYPQANTNFVISNKTEKTMFEKIYSQINKLSIENGEIVASASITGTAVFEVRVNGSDEFKEYYTISDIKLEENNIYKIRMYFKGGDYYLNSDYSNEVEAKIAIGISDLDINNGKISFTSNNATNYKAIVKSAGQEKIVQNIGVLASYNEDGQKISFDLKDLISSIIPLEYNSLGENLVLTIEAEGSKTDNELDRQKFAGLSNVSNNAYINYRLVSEILNLSLSQDTFSFNTCGAENYYAILQEGVNDSINVNLKNLGSFVNNNNVDGIATFSMTEIIKNAYAETYGTLSDIIKIYVNCGGLVNPFKISNDVVLFNKVDASNDIYINLLNSPTNLNASKLFDLTTDSSMIDDDNIGLNRLYFDCNENAKMFEFNYTNSANETKTKILTTGNYLSVYKTKDNVITYVINTNFLEADTYSFTIKAMSNVKGSFNQSLNAYVYDYDSFDYANLTDITKLNTPEEITCTDGKITIVDNSPNLDNCIYILSVNDKYIYDDVLDAGQDLNDLLDMISSGETDQIVKAVKLINNFKTKERILPASCCGTMEISCLKIAIPSLPENALGLLLNLEKIKKGGAAIQADKPKEITVTRLETPKPVLKNGIIEWNAIENAESYFIYQTKEEDGKVVIDYDKLISKIDAGNSLKYNLYEHFSGLAGTYSVAMLAATTQNNYLSSSKSADCKFEILQIPNLYIENGKINWNLVMNASGYRLDVYKDGSLFDTLYLNKDDISYDAQKSSKNNLLESGEYEFRITALGEIERNSLGNIIDETNVIKSLTSAENACKAFKLQTPQAVRVEDGLVALSSVNENTGVEYYSLFINGKEVKVDRNQLKFELNAQYKAGIYEFYYRAIGGSTCLTSNYSDRFSAKKLDETSKIKILDGELVWEEVESANYDNGNSTVKYSFTVNTESQVYKDITTETLFEISKQDLVPYGIYSFTVKALGDNSYYLNGNTKVLQKVVKLGDVKNIRIENGVLTWTDPKPSDFVGLPANAKASPNGYKLIIEKGYDSYEYNLEDGVENFVLDASFEDGTYSISIQNLGDRTDSDEYLYANSKIQNKVIYKLLPLTNLNISDGINLKWDNANTRLVQEFYVYISLAGEQGVTNYEGVLESKNSQIKFENICYYINSDNERILILSTDKNIITSEDGTQRYNSYKVYKFDGEGTYTVSIKAYGNTRYINSEISNTISIVRPKEVQNLLVQNGKVSWAGSVGANGYILTLTRYTINESGEKVIDTEYNKNYSLVYVNKTYYNLQDVNYYYNISVRAYSLVASEENQTMASKPVVIEDYLFNTFTDGNGTSENPYLITDEQTLALIKYNNTAYYKLSQNIDLTNNWTPLFTDTYPFAGCLDGNGKTIKGLRIVDTYTYSGLLGYIGTDTISDDRVVDGVRTEFIPSENQTVKGKVYNIDFNDALVSSGLNVAVIAGVNEGEILKVNIRNARITSNSEILVDVGASYKSIYSGLVVAENKGRIEQVSVQNDESNTKVEPTAKTTLYSGGICAINSGEIIYCYVNVDVYGTVSGGISAINNGTIDFCGFYGMISCANYSSNRTTLIACAGGICAINNAGARVSNVIVESDRFATSEGGISNVSKVNVQSNIVYIGGLIGDNKGKCFNGYAKIDLFNRSGKDVDCVLGYLFGYNTNNTVNNNKYVLSDETEALVESSGVVIDSSNCEVSGLTSALIDEFNTSKDNNNFEWAEIGYYQFNDEIKMQINFGFNRI